MAASDWASLGGVACAAIGLALTALSIGRSRRTADLQALQKFADDANKREAALAEAETDDARLHAFNELLNFLELYASAYNNRLVIGRGSKKIVRHKLEDCFIELEAATAWRPHIGRAVDRFSTFDEITKSTAAHRREIEQRKLERERTAMQTSNQIGALVARVATLESIIEIFSDLLPPPKFFASETVRAFRYENPDARHFCLLKAVRVVSALNAAIELVQKGYTQELSVLMRTVSECTRHIEYVLDADDSEEHRSNVKTYLREFFEDIHREPEADIKSVLIRERRVNEQLGKTLDRISQETNDGLERIPAAKLIFRSSRAFSFYVHARYPEAMDLFGGSPGRWHLRA
jgi:hypothetical protein